MDRLTEASKADSLLIFGVDLSVVSRKVATARNDYILKFRKENFTKTDSFFTRGRRKGMIKGYKYAPNAEHIRGTSDILDSMTTGMFHKNYMAGHGSKYYNRDRYNKQTENFANLFAVYVEGGDPWRDTQALFPNLTKEFEKIMDEIIAKTLKEG